MPGFHPLIDSSYRWIVYILLDISQSIGSFLAIVQSLFSKEQGPLNPAAASVHGVFSHTCVANHTALALVIGLHIRHAAFFHPEDQEDF